MYTTTGAFDDRLEELSPSKAPEHAANTEDSRQDEDVGTHINPKMAELRQKLAHLQVRRQKVSALRSENAALTNRLQNRLHELEHQKQLFVADIIAWKSRRRHAEKQLEESYYWNAMNDAFLIAPQGPFATINGVRLGCEAEVVAPQTQLGSGQNGSQTNLGNQASNTKVASSALGVVAATVALPGRYLGFGGGTATSEPTPQSSSSQSQNIPLENQVTKIKVPWTEINSALGQIALLLSILEQSPHTNIHFPNHSIFPQGSTSKIGLRQPNIITGPLSRGKEVPIVAMYHLYSDDSFQLFGKRNFNLALRALTECLNITALAIAQRDRTTVMPFEMQVEHDNPSAPCTIGGLPVLYAADNGIQWTRVVKYMLINAKWCVAYHAKHVDQ